MNTNTTPVQVGHRSTRSFTMRTVAILMVFGVLWILAADRTSDLLVPDPVVLSAIQIVAVLFYVGLTVLLFMLVRQGLRALSRTEEAVRATEADYRQMFETNPAVQLLIDPADGRIVDANSAAVTFYGYSLKDLQARKIGDIDTLPEGRMAEELDNASREQRKYSDVRQRLASGEICDVEVHSVPITMGGRTLLYSIVHDITERRRAEEALLRHNASMAALHDTTLGLISRRDSANLLQDIVVRAGELLNTEHCFIYRVASGEGGVSDLVLQAARGGFAQQLGYHLPLGEGIAGRVWETGELLSVADYRAWDGRRQDLDGMGIHAIVGVPLRNGSEVVGVLSAASFDEGRTFDSEDLRLLALFAEMASLAIENTGLYDTLQQELAERELAERELREQDARLNLIVGQMACVLWSTDMELRFTSSLGRSLSYLGLKPDQVVGISLFDYFQTSDPSFAGISASYRALNGESVTFEMPWSGTPFQAHIEPFRDAEGHIIGTIGMAFDVSEQKNYQRRLEEHASAQTHLLRQLLTAQESERRRLSMEMHDGPLQSLGVAILAIDRTLRRQVLGEHQEAARELTYVRDTVDDIVSDIRAILAELSLNVLMGYGLVPALRDHTERFTQLTGIRVDLRNNLQHRVPSHIELLMYRLVQESLANVRKHSGASQVDISLYLEDGHLVMSVADDGSGFDPEKATPRHAAGEHIGLASMRQRITDAQGDLRVQSAPGKGTNLTFTVPVSFRTTELNTGDLTPHARHLSGRE